MATALARVEEQGRRNAKVAAEEARAATEEVWRGHLARAVLLTRQEAAARPDVASPPPPGANVPHRYTGANGAGQLALLSDMTALQSALKHKQQGGHKQLQGRPAEPQRWR